MNLVDRVKRILLSPSPEWEVIDGEATTPARSTPVTSCRSPRSARSRP